MKALIFIMATALIAGCATGSGQRVQDKINGFFDSVGNQQQVDQGPLGNVAALTPTPTTTPTH